MILKTASLVGTKIGLRSFALLTFCFSFNVLCCSLISIDVAVILEFWATGLTFLEFLGISGKCAVFVLHLSLGVSFAGEFC